MKSSASAIRGRRVVALIWILGCLLLPRKLAERERKVTVIFSSRSDNVISPEWDLFRYRHDICNHLALAPPKKWPKNRLQTRKREPLLAP